MKRGESGRVRGFASRAVHTGERPARPDFIPTTTPIYPSSSFSYPNIETLDAVFGNEAEGYVYTRHGNPTTRALELAIADLEGAEDALACGSGMAALHAAVLNEVRAGANVVAARDLYGASVAMFQNLFSTVGVKTTFVDVRDLDQLERAIVDSKARAVVLETISNPLLCVADLPRVAEIAHAHRAKVIVDNTFASPLLVNPIRFGVDTVVHSTTKYIGGHGDATGGAIATSHERAMELVELTKLSGAILGPFEAWLTLRGLKTLPLRMRKQCDNAAAIAAWLRGHSRVARVWYTDETARELGGLFNNELRGAMVAFEIAGGGRDEVFRFFTALEMCVPATTLGDVYTLVLYPAMSSHRALSPKQRAEAGISEGLVRLSAGIEDVEDIIADLDQALARV